MESILPDSRSALFDQLSARAFTWWPEHGVGFYPVEEGTKPYDAGYFERYAEMSNTEVGHRLNHTRCQMVRRHYTGALTDVGVGSGAFVTCRNKAFRERTTGFDVNPEGVKWLMERGLYADPWRFGVNAITLWDVLEHIPDFRPLLANVRQYVFVSLPIFSGPLDVLRSKHFRRDEHVWYFTIHGIRKVFAELGFDCVEINDAECALGRESIGSFVFKRREP
jgi:hypothetical protein